VERVAWRVAAQGRQWRRPAASTRTGSRETQINKGRDRVRRGSRDRIDLDVAFACTVRGQIWTMLLASLRAAALLLASQHLSPRLRWRELAGSIETARVHELLRQRSSRGCHWDNNLVNISTLFTMQKGHDELAKYVQTCWSNINDSSFLSS
jgi:hypothetical protein